LHYVQAGIPVFLIDPNDVEVYRKDVSVIKAGASEGIRILTSNLIKQLTSTK